MAEPAQIGQTGEPLQSGLGRDGVSMKMSGE